jgi:hypothetical protein
LQVNDLLRKHQREDLIIKPDEELKMKQFIELLAAFKEESLKCESEKTPTIQFVYLAYVRLKEECQPRETDSQMIRRIRGSLLRELDRHYQPHIRHLVGVFLWPTFRELEMLSPENQKQVHNIYNSCAGLSNKLVVC